MAAWPTPGAAEVEVDVEQAGEQALHAELRRQALLHQFVHRVLAGASYEKRIERRTTRAAS